MIEIGAVMGRERAPRAVQHHGNLAMWSGGKPDGELILDSHRLIIGLIQRQVVVVPGGAESPRA